MARLLKRSPYQVIALNEVFDETVRDALIEEAESGSDAFHFVVEDLDGGGLEDSGLVIFSRLEPVRFASPQPVPGQHGQLIGPGFSEPYSGTNEYADTRFCASTDVWWKGQPDDGEVDSWISGSANCLVVFHRYRACTDETPDDSPFGAECEASKGVAYVRLRQLNGRELDVFWSHTQATLRAPEYELPLPDFLGERRKQFEELAAMVQRWSPPTERDVVILGDLNVDGNRAPLGKDEYLKLIASPNSLLGKMGFRDLWPESAPKNDFGLTYSHRNGHVPKNMPEERLDYVLWRDQNGNDTCAQHPFVERHFDAPRPGGGTVDLSDHFGVGVELRRRNRDVGGGDLEPCAPALAKTMADLMPTAEMTGTLQVPGACHWLRLEPGTWTVTSFENDPLRIGAWNAMDISEPIQFFRGDGQLDHIEKHDEAQVAADIPFYLKICWLDPTKTGVYRIRVAANVGADPQHPVVLTLNRSTPVAYGSQFGANPSTLLWSLVKLPATFSQSSHAMELSLPLTSTKFRTGTAPVGGASPPIKWIGGFTDSWGLKAIGAFGGSDDIELFIVIEREPPANPAHHVPFTMRPITDHHEVRLSVLECIEQEDATGDDHVRMTYAADGRELKIVDLGDFDEGQDVDLQRTPSWD